MSDMYAEYEREILGDPVEPEKVEAVEIPEEIPEETESEASEEIEEVNESEAVDEPVESQEVELPEDLNSLAEAIGVPVEKLYALEMGLPGGGKMTIGQYKDNATKYGNIDETISQLERQREELSLQKSEIEQLRSQAMTMPDELLQAQAQVKQIQATYQGINWAELEANDPGQAALQKQNLNMAFNQAQQQAEFVKNQVFQSQQASKDQALAGYGQRLNTAMPGWDEQKNVEITQFMLGEGIPANVIEMIPYTESGEVFVKLMDELQKLRTEKSSANATAKKVSKIPINLKTGTTGQKSTSKTKKLDAIINQAQGGQLPRKQREAAENAVFERYS